MKILSINVHYQDGLGYQDYYLGLELQRMGHEVIFLSSDWHFAFPDYDNTVRHILGKPNVGVGEFTNEYGATVIRVKAKLRQSNFIWLHGLFSKINEVKPDLIISHGLLTWQTARLALFGARLNIPIIYDDHTHSEVQRKSLIAKVLYRVYRSLLAGQIQKTAKKIIGITPETIPFIKNVLGIDSPNVQMIPLGTDTSIFYPDHLKREQYRSEWSINAEQLLITYTGKIYPAKKAHLIIEAIDTLIIKDPELTGKLIIQFVGDIASSQTNLIKAKSESCGCRVILTPSVSQSKLAEVYNGTDIAVWPASATTSTIDASACGTPIVITNRLPERLEFGSGIGISPGSVPELSEALAKLIYNSTLRDKMGKGGEELVEKKLNWEIIARDFIS